MLLECVGLGRKGFVVGVADEVICAAKVGRRRRWFLQVLRRQVVIANRHRRGQLGLGTHHRIRRQRLRQVRL